MTRLVLSIQHCDVLDIYRQSVVSNCSLLCFIIILWETWICSNVNPGPWPGLVQHVVGLGSRSPLPKAEIMTMKGLKGLTSFLTRCAIYVFSKWS